MVYKWSFLNLLANNEQLVGVHYLLTGTDNDQSVSSEGNHTFSKNTVTKKLSEIVETDLVQWIEKDTTVDDINPIKLAIENQLKSLNNVQKVDFPWLAGTFTIG